MTRPISDLIIRRLEADDIQPIASAFQELGWHKPASQYEQYLQEQTHAQRAVAVAFYKGLFSGYLTICWTSKYPPFQAAQVPEIVDLNVLPQYRRRGIGTALMNLAEDEIRQVSASAGIGVGLTADYGAAQQLYVRRGYIPDGRGLYQGRSLHYGDSTVVDDDLVLYFTKVLK